MSPSASGGGTGYDGDGNPYAYKGYAGTFDEDDRLAGWNGVSAAYGLDGLRSKKAGSATAYTLRDEGGDPVEELSSGGTVTALSTYGAQGLASRLTSASAFYLYDVQGIVATQMTKTDVFAL